MFTGRIHELNRIDDTFMKLKEGNPSHLMIVGERGIGKSSLLLFCNMLAKGEVTWQASTCCNYLPIHFAIDSDLTRLGLVKKISGSIERHLRKEEKLLALFQKSWQFLKRIEIAGSKISSDISGDNDSIFDDFVYSLADTCESLCKTTFLNEHGVTAKKDGLVLLIDEADSASPGLGLGAFLKNLSEALQTQGCNRVLYILSGLPRLRDVLRESHPSSLRLFEELELLPLRREHIKEVYERGLKHVNVRSTAQYRYSPEALERMIGSSEGYPHFIQQIGFSTFEINTDAEISIDTVNDATFGHSGAIDLIGDRYYRNLYYDNIKEDAYREILNAMAERPGGITTRKQLLPRFVDREQILDNGIRALKERNIILPIQGKRGEYRLQWVGFGIWIKFFTERGK